MGSLFQERIAAGEAVIESRNVAKPGVRKSLLPLFFVQTDLSRQPGGPRRKGPQPLPPYNCRSPYLSAIPVRPFGSDPSVYSLLSREPAW